MAKSKEYNKGSAKKWAILLGSIVLVAIIVVVIILAIPPNTYTAIEALNKFSNTSYLTVDSEQKAFASFKEKTSANSLTSAYAKELSDAENIAYSIDIVLDFYNDYIVFAKDSKALKSNYKDIKQGLEKAKTSQKNLVKIVVETNKLSDSSSTYIQSAMVDFREEFLNYLNSSTRAIKGLEDVYNKALGQVSYNNLASKMILSVVNDYLDVLTSKFQTLVSIDKKGGSMTDYSDAFVDLGISAKAEFFNKFTKFYLDRLLEEIYDFYFDSDLREKFETANDFYALYSQQDTKSIIESMQTVESQNKITKTFEGITDENGSFSKICEFLKGEM